MAIEVGRGEIPISPNMDDFSRDVAKKASAVGEDAGRKLNTSIAPQIKQLGAAIGGAFAVTEGVQFLKGAIGAASDLNETVSKSRTIFGPAADDMERWASGAAKSIGQSKKGALDAAATFGNLFTQLKIAPDLAAKMSKGMVELASDFASFHNANPEDVIQAQTAAFRGEYDALQRFVPTINAAAVEQRALEMTGKTSTKMLTDQDKALAVNALMMEGAGAAAGDFSRTSDGLANKQRIQSAQWADLTAKIGSGLLPVMLAVTSFITGTLIPGIEAVTGWLGRNKDVVAAVAIGIMVALVPAFVAWAIAAGTAAAATLLAAAPVIAIGVAIAALAFVVIKNWDTITGAFGAAKDFIVEHINQILILGLGPIGVAIVLLKENWETVWKAVQKAVEIAWDIIRPIIDTMRDAIDKISGPLSTVLGAAGKVGGAVGGVLGHIPGFAGGVTNFDGGLAWVGENGPELAYLPRGTDVIPAPTAAMAGGGIHAPIHVDARGIHNPREVGDYVSAAVAWRVTALTGGRA